MGVGREWGPSKGSQETMYRCLFLSFSSPNLHCYGSSHSSSSCYLRRVLSSKNILVPPPTPPVTMTVKEITVLLPVIHDLLSF